MVSWSQCVTQLQGQLSPTEFGMWIRPLQTKVESGILKIFAPNLFVLKWVQERYAEAIVQTLKQLTGASPPKVLFLVGSCSDPSPLPASLTSSLPLPSLLPREKREVGERKELSEVRVKRSRKLNDALTFQSFVEGPCNQTALLAARHLCSTAIPSSDAPLIFYGASGLGKTHLLHAMGNQIASLRRGAGQVTYLHADRMLQILSWGHQAKRLHHFKKQVDAADLLLIDDIQFFSKKPRLQEDFRHLFEYLIDQKKAFVLTCDRPLEQLDFEPGLASRLGAGLKIELQPPSMETAIEILKRKASIRQMNLPDETASWIVETLGCSVRALEGALTRIAAHANFERRSISHGWVVNTLQKTQTQRPKSDFRSIDPQLIIQTVMRYHNIASQEALMRACRSRCFVEPRQIAMALMKCFTRLTLLEIGRSFCKRNHTTVIHACRLIDRKKQEDRSFLLIWNQLRREIHESAMQAAG